MCRNRDMGINFIKSREDDRCYEMGLGIIILDDVYPGIPGDVRCDSAYPFPIWANTCPSGAIAMEPWP